MNTANEKKAGNQNANKGVQKKGNASKNNRNDANKRSAAGKETKSR